MYDVNNNNINTKNNEKKKSFLKIRGRGAKLLIGGF
jgi:hypothetical protein